MKGRPRFFCENCGREVPRDAKSCSGCGRFFSSVRCPCCGFVGAESLFASGCPVCGYSAPPPGGAAPPPSETGRKEGAPAGPLPLWVWAVTLAAVMAALAATLWLL